MAAAARPDPRSVIAGEVNDSLSARIAAFVCATNTPRLSDDVMLGVRSAALDGIASILSGVSEPVSRHVLELVSSYDRGGQATIIGFGGRASLAGAALVNGTMAHA